MSSLRMPPAAAPTPSTSQSPASFPAVKVVPAAAATASAPVSLEEMVRSEGIRAQRRITELQAELAGLHRELAAEKERSRQAAAVVVLDRERQEELAKLRRQVEQRQQEAERKEAEAEVERLRAEVRVARRHPKGGQSKGGGADSRPRELRAEAQGEGGRAELSHAALAGGEGGEGGEEPQRAGGAAERQTPRAAHNKLSITATAVHLPSCRRALALPLPCG
jgi:Skp family chaperone for outer membrane proteins